MIRTYDIELMTELQSRWIELNFDIDRFFKYSIKGRNSKGGESGGGSMFLSREIRNNCGISSYAYVPVVEKIN
jgi:hypothetical protein